tara:strand:- start:317 stop:1252 length:936 start_codon:yes stop_codon:yes gene_type:complete
MIDLKYSKVTQILKISNLSDSPIKLVIWLKDLGTNLYAGKFWVEVAAGDDNYLYKFYDSLPFTPLNSPGMVFEAYNGDEVFEEKIIWGDEDKFNNKFHTPKQIAWDHWNELISKPTLPITKEDVVYDLGTHYGTFTMWAKDAKQVYSFEPTPQIIPYLKETFLNMDNIEIFEKAIGAKNTTQQFRINDEFHSSNTLWEWDGSWNADPRMMVDVVNLEDFISKNNLLPPTFLKIDIEGYEWEFIDSLSDKFFDTVQNINLEFHMISYENLGKMLLRLMGLGFKLELKEEISFERMMGTINLFKDNHTYNKLT